MNPKAALITGGTSPIGQTISLYLGKKGYDVAIHYHQQAEKAEALVKEIIEAGGNAHYFQADLSIQGEAEKLYTTVRKFMHPSVLINNASIFQKDTMETLNTKTRDQHIQINAYAPISLMEQIKKNNKGGEKGLIINMLDSNTPNPHYASYSISKAMLWEATQLAAKTYAPNIRVNALALGYIGALDSEKPYTHNWLNYPIMPKDVADAVLFLIKSEGITAEKITLSGGRRFSGA